MRARQIERRREESKVLRWKKLVFSAQKLEDEMERRKKGLKGISKLFLHFIEFLTQSFQKRYVNHYHSRVICFGSKKVTRQRINTIPYNKRKHDGRVPEKIIRSGNGSSTCVCQDTGEERKEKLHCHSTRDNVPTLRNRVF